MDYIEGTVHRWKNKSKGWLTIKWDGDPRAVTVDMGILLEEKWSVFILNLQSHPAGPMFMFGKEDGKAGYSCLLSWLA